MSRQQDVEAAVGKLRHHIFQLARRHLSVGDGKLQLRHQIAQPFMDPRQILDPGHT